MQVSLLGANHGKVSKQRCRSYLCALVVVVADSDSVRRASFHPHSLALETEHDEGMAVPQHSPGCDVTTAFVRTLS